jgi:hypothetical protein
MPRDEVIAGLRGEVSSLTIKRNRLGQRCAQMANAVGKQKAQTAADQRYIDALESHLTAETIAMVRQEMKAARGALTGGGADSEAGSA